MKQPENQVLETIESISTPEYSWNVERSDQELDEFLLRRLGDIGLDSIDELN